MSSSFDQKLRELEKDISNLRGDGKYRVSCTSILVIVALCVPLVVGLGLYFTQPKFVQSLDPKTKMYSKSIKRLLLITLGITLLSWILLYCFGLWQGYDLSFDAICAIYSKS